MKLQITNQQSQTKLRQNISIYLLVRLMSIGFAFGQTADERKLELVVQTGHAKGFYEIAFSKDGKLITSSGENEIKLWDVASRREIRTMISDDRVEINSIKFSYDGKILASSSSENIIRTCITD